MSFILKEKVFDIYIKNICIAIFEWKQTNKHNAKLRIRQLYLAENQNISVKG